MLKRFFSAPEIQPWVEKGELLTEKPTQVTESAQRMRNLVDAIEKYQPTDVFELARAYDILLKSDLGQRWIKEYFFVDLKTGENISAEFKLKNENDPVWDKSCWGCSVKMMCSTNPSRGKESFSSEIRKQEQVLDKKSYQKIARRNGRVNFRSQVQTYQKMLSQSLHEFHLMNSVSFENVGDRIKIWQKNSGYCQTLSRPKARVDLATSLRYLAQGCPGIYSSENPDPENTQKLEAIYRDIDVALSASEVTGTVVENWINTQARIQELVNEVRKVNEILQEIQ